MNGQEERLRDLATRISEGDGEAANELRRLLEPSLVVVVRQVVNSGTDSSSRLARRIRAAAERLADSCPELADTEPHVQIRRIARQVCDTIILCLRGRVGISGRSLQDTKPLSSFWPK